MISLRRQFFKHTTIVVFMVMLLSAIAAERHYAEQIKQQSQNALKLHVYAILSVAQRGNELVIPAILSNPEFNTLDSQLWAMAYNQQQQVVWQSVSSPKASANLPELTAGKWLSSEENIGDEHFLTLSYAFVWGETEPFQVFYIKVAENSQVMTAELLKFRKVLVTIFCLITAILLVLQFVVLRSAFKPISQLESEIAELGQGKIKHLSSNYPKELQGVSYNLNSLIDSEHNQKERYRSSMADLAHSLKTPITIISGEIDNYPNNPVLKDALTRVNNSIQYQLQRAVISGHKLLSKGTPVNQIVDTVSSTLLKIFSDKDVEFTSNVDVEVLFYGDENDLLEVLGNLLDNAFKFCHQIVQVKCYLSNSTICIEVEDDGKGLAQYQQEAIFNRGERLDQQALGQGIGLAIVYDIVKEYQGSISVSRSELGGARFELTLPISDQ